MQTRINSYVRFLHRNYRMLDGGIRRSKTDMGTSLSVVVAEPKRAGVLKERVSVFVHVIITRNWRTYPRQTRVPLTTYNEQAFVRVTTSPSIPNKKGGPRAALSA
jgi:hypothetical protein